MPGVTEMRLYRLLNTHLPAFVGTVTMQKKHAMPLRTVAVGASLCPANGVRPSVRLPVCLPVCLCQCNWQETIIRTCDYRVAAAATKRVNTTYLAYTTLPW